MSVALHSLTIDPAVDAAIRVALALLLGISAFHKISEFPSFRRALEDYRLLPAAGVGPTAASLVLLEKIAAVGLLVTPIRMPFAILAAALFGLYAIAIAINLTRGRRDIDCGCNGPDGARGLHPGLLLRNVLLIFAAAAVALPASARDFRVVDVLTVLGGVIAATFVYQAGQGLVAVSIRAGAMQRRERAR